MFCCALTILVCALVYFYNIITLSVPGVGLGCGCGGFADLMGLCLFSLVLTGGFDCLVCDKLLIVSLFLNYYFVLLCLRFWVWIVMLGGLGDRFAWFYRV